MSGGKMVQRGPASLRPSSASQGPSTLPQGLGPPRGQPPCHSTGVVLVEGRPEHGGVKAELRSATYAGSCTYCRRFLSPDGHVWGKVVELTGDGVTTRLCLDCLKDLIDGYHTHLAKENL